jgi:hypothetical protein
MKKFGYSRGLGLVEIVVGTAIISLSLVGLVTAFNVFMRTGLSNTNKIQATYIMEEGLEAIRYLRDGGYSSNISTLTSGVPYYLLFDGSDWSTTTTETLIDNKFERTVTIADVYRRDSDDDIVASTSPDSNTLDTNTIQATIEVSWEGSGSVLSEVSAVEYLTNFFDN